MVYITKSFQGILNFGAKREIFENARELQKTKLKLKKFYGVNCVHEGAAG